MDQTWLGTHKCHCGTNSFPVAARNPHYSAPCLNRLSSTRVKKEICHFDGFLQFTLHIGAKFISYFMANFEILLEWWGNLTSFSWSLDFFFLTVGQDIFGNKIPFLWSKFATYFHYLFMFFLQFLGKSIKPTNLCKKEGPGLLVTIGSHICLIFIRYSFMKTLYLIFFNNLKLHFNPFSQH